MTNKKLRYRDSGITKKSFHDIFVHTDCRAKDSRSDKGDTDEPEEPLHGTILAECPVEHRKDDIERRMDCLPIEKKEFAATPRYECDEGIFVCIQSIRCEELLS